MTEVLTDDDDDHACKLNAIDLHHIGLSNSNRVLQQMTGTANGHDDDLVATELCTGIM